MHRYGFKLTHCWVLFETDLTPASWRCMPKTVSNDRPEKQDVGFVAMAASVIY